MIYDYFPELDGNQSIDNGKMGRQLFKGGGGGGGTQTTQNQLDPTVRPFVEYGLQEAKQLYQTDTPSYYPYQTYVDPSQQTQQALQAAQTRALAGSPLVPAAQQQQLATIQGQNLGLNPYFANALQGAAGVATTQFQDALSSIASQASQAGRYGSGAMGNLQDRASTNLAKELTSRAGELAYQNYAAERAAQERAIQQAPALAQADYQDIQQLLNVGQTAEDYQRQALEADIGRFEFEENKPYTKLQSYLSAAYGAPMGQVSTTTSSGGGKVMGAPVLVGAGIGAISSLAMGKDPLMGAAMGGLSGGAFGGSAGFGSGFTEGGLMDLGSGMLTSSIPEVATTGAAQSAMTAGAPSSLLGSQGAQINTALNPFDVGSSMLSSGGPVSATQAGFQAASPMGTVVDNAFINPSTYTGGLDDMGVSGLSTGGGYIPAPQDATTMANLQEYGGLTAPVKTGLLEDIGTTAYEGLAKMSPLEQVQLGQMGLDAFSPEEQQQVQAQLGQIRPAGKVTAGTPLQVRPTRPTFKPRFA